MTTQKKGPEPAPIPAIDTGGEALRDRAAAAREIGAAIQGLKKKAESQNLKMVAYLLNLAELEVSDCAASLDESAQVAPGKRA